MKIEKRLIEVTWLPMSEHGHSNGYVGVPKGHPLFEVNYLDIECSIHGGLTWSEDHLPGQPQDGLWWLGFDVCHSGDNLKKWPLSRCEQELESLYKQVLDMKAKL